MRSLHTPMTWEEFERMPHRFGWKNEYWDGCAHLRPMETHVYVLMQTEHREGEMPRGFRLRRVVQDDAKKLIECFIETFVDGIEFCDWSHEDICRHARRNITDYFAGNIKRRGAPLSVSVCALAEDDDALIAAALFTDYADAAALDLLMVRPRFRYRGLARAMVINAMNELHARGRRALRSAYVVCNEESAAWHKAFGFAELPDLGLARLRRSHFAVETGRCEADKSTSVEERERISREYNFWKRRVTELEQVCERDGFDAVTPIRRFAWQLIKPLSAHSR